jgi:anti-sigma B factor antagonist
MGGELRLDVRRGEGATIVRVNGEVDLATSPELRECLTGLDGIVVVDLEEVGFLDSSAVNALIGSKKHLTAQGGALRLQGAQPHVRHVFDVMGMSDWFELEPDDRDLRGGDRSA